jgi:hypothetical protein
MHKPNYILVSTSPRELVDDAGLHSKSWRRRFQKWGYDSHYWFLRGHEHGGVVRQDRCVLVLRRKDDSVPPVRIPEIITTEGGPRTARNMLQPAGLPKTVWWPGDWTPVSNYPRWVSEAASPCLLLGETVQKKLPVFSPDGCLPDSIGALVHTERGVRRLQSEELGKAKGIPEEWMRQGHLSVRAVNKMTDLHIWTAVASSLNLSPTWDKAELSKPSDESDLDEPWPQPQVGQQNEPEW